MSLSPRQKIAVGAGAGLGTAGLLAAIVSTIRSEKGAKAQKAYWPKRYDADGYDAEGFDRWGYDREGFNREGLDRGGYNRKGFNRFGFSRDGFNAEGLDRKGYDRRGYNSDGLDRSGHGSEHYEREIERIKSLAEKAHGRMKEYEFPYALHDIRNGFEIASRCIIEHWKGTSYLRKTLSGNLDRCKKYLGEELYEKARSAVRHCNDTQHDSEPKRAEKTFNQVFFCYKTLLEVAEVAGECSKQGVESQANGDATEF